MFLDKSSCNLARRLSSGKSCCVKAKVVVFG